MENFSRKLGAIENVFDIMENIGGMTSITIAKIEGLIQPGILEKALKLLQKRHYILQVHIVDLEDGKYFQSEGTKQIPLKVIKKYHSNQYFEIAEEEIHKKFLRDTNPLCRITLLDGSETNNVNEILITCHHTIIDGNSHMNLLGDLLYYYTQIANGDNISDPITMPLLPPLEEIVNRNLIEKNQIQNTPKDIAPKQSPKIELLIEQEAEPIDRRTHFLTRIINPEITQTLIKRCQEEKTSLYGAVSAAMLFAVGQNTFTNTPIQVSCNSTFNLRKYCLPEVKPEQIGCFVSGIQDNYILEANSELWNLARECQSRIFESIYSGSYMDIIFNEQSNMNEDIMMQISKNNKMGRLSTLVITNIGKSNLNIQYDPLKLKELYGAVAHHSIGPSFSLMMLIFEQQLFFTFAYATPLLSEKTAQLLVDSVINNIEKACIYKSLSL